MFAACGGPNEIDGPISAVRVYGRVTTNDANPAEGVAMHIGWSPASHGACDGEIAPIDSDTTDALGAYSGTVWNWGSGGFTACIRVIAEPAGAGLLPDTALRAGVVASNDGRQDSVAVNLVLRPAGS
jgi:hypothetical protein